MKNLICFLILFCVVGCKQSGVPATGVPIFAPDQPVAKTLHVFGDQIGFEYGPILASALSLELVNHAYQNSGFSSDFCDGHTGVIRDDVNIDENSIVVFVAGFNEANYYGTPGITIIENCLITFQQRMFDVGAEVYIAGPPYIDPSLHMTNYPFFSGTDAVTDEMKLKVKSLIYHFTVLVDLGTLRWPSVGGAEVIADKFFTAIEGAE